MADLLVRGVRDDAKAKLASRAASNGRSLQAEARRILEEAALNDGKDAGAVAPSAAVSDAAGNAASNINVVFFISCGTPM